MGGYQQWRLPKQLYLPNSNKSKNQIERFEKILNQWKRAILEQKDIMVLMDSNIDTGIGSNHNNNYDITPLYTLLTQFLDKHNITQLNTKNTHFPIYRKMYNAKQNIYIHWLADVQ